MILIEPLKLPLNKKYNLNVIREIAVTDSFLSMDIDNKECQEESFSECVTQKYKKTLMDLCQCLPFQIRLNNEVCIGSEILKNLNNKMSDSTVC